MFSQKKVLFFVMIVLSVVSTQCNITKIKPMKLTSKLPTWPLNNTRVFLRADLNIPLVDQKIANDFRLRALLPTLNFLLEHGAKVVLATHIGRPNGHDPNLSTKILVPWFEKQGYTIIHTESIEKAQHIELKPSQILLLENLRFFPGEKNHDAAFAKQLASLADCYVNDAFGIVHRADTSVTLLAQEFQPEQRTIGFVIEKELDMLNTLIQNPEQPCIAILGGGKVTDKIPLMQGMMSKIQAILLCPAIVFTFAKALGKPVGKSLVDDTALEICTEIINQAQKQNIRLVLPIDYQVADKSIEGPLTTIEAKNFPENGIGISIGPKTIELFSQEIQHAQTIFFNAAMGFTHRPETMKGTHAILKAIAHATGTSVIAGGDSVAAAQQIGIEDHIDHLSTGGGATLAYLSGQELPGLQVFLPLKN